MERIEHWLDWAVISSTHRRIATGVTPSIPASNIQLREIHICFRPPFSGTVTVDRTHYLAGGQDFGPFPVPGDPSSIPHLYTRNLTPDKTGLPEGGHTFDEFKEIMRNGKDFDHIHPSCTGPPGVSPGVPDNCLPFPFNGDLLQVMPWPAFANMTDRDLLAIYTYLSALKCNPGPEGLDPKLYARNVCE